MKITIPFLICLLVFPGIYNDLWAQKTGVNTQTPRANLSVAGESHVLSIEGNNPFISLYDQGSYKGYLWYHTDKIELATSTAEPVQITANYNDVATFLPDGKVGINTNTPTETLDVNGKINLKGLSINNNTGIRGEAYSTGGPSINPEWKALPFANGTRFAVTLTGSTYNGALAYSEDYNTNTFAITINSTSITVNKTGLYHLDGFLSFSISYSGNYLSNTPPMMSFFFLAGSNIYYGANSQVMDERPYYGSGSSFKYYNTQSKFTYDLYLTQGQTLYLNRSFSGQPGPATYINRGTITGVLISE